MYAYVVLFSSTLQDFYEKYQFLIGSESTNLSSQINTFLSKLGFGSEHFQIGKSKVCLDVPYPAKNNIGRGRMSEGEREGEGGRERNH